MREITEISAIGKDWAEPDEAVFNRQCWFLSRQ
jgi:hypothetical protein